MSMKRRCATSATAATFPPGKSSPTTPSAKYHFEYEWDLATMEPLVAKPHSPDNRDTAHNCRDVKLDRAYIGSCTGGKITDMIFAANILKGQR
jgi:3-isopropylmalate/(R)-2-methylmalate dehydratase large subunit